MKEARFKLYKTTLNEWQGGRPKDSAVDPARFRGVTPVYAIYDGEEPIIAFRRKRDAQKFQLWALANWDGLGDPELSYSQSTGDYDLLII